MTVPFHSIRPRPAAARPGRRRQTQYSSDDPVVSQCWRLTPHPIAVPCHLRRPRSVAARPGRRRQSKQMKNGLEASPCWHLTPHPIAMPSSSPEASSRMFGENATVYMLECISSVVVLAPGTTSHSCTGPSSSPEASCIPSGDNATEDTMDWHLISHPITVPRSQLSPRPE